jgi:cysteine desulfurase
VNLPVYLDCNATTPLAPEVRETLLHFLTEDYGNEGSRTHEYGARARQAVQKARDQVGAVVAAKRDEVLFTSGATESNNLAILGLIPYGERTGKRHVISTRIEHKAVLEPVQELENRGFEVDWLDSDSSGLVRTQDLKSLLRPDTLLVSVMAANNETGVIQPLKEIAESLAGCDTYLHTDAAQSFGKVIDPLRNPRIDLISISGHKIYGPKGIGALVVRRRGYSRVPLEPLFRGGGQERGLRPGTLAVPLIAALGTAAQSAIRDHGQRAEYCRRMKEALMEAIAPLKPRIHGKGTEVMDHVLNFALPGLDSEALIVRLKDLIALSNGSACTSSNYTPSHVIKAMGYSDDEANEAVRLSWCHLTPDVNWPAVVERLAAIR